MFQFYWPWMALLLPLPLLAKLLAPIKKNEGVPELRFPGMDRLKKAFSSYQFNATASPLFSFFLYLIWVLIVLALMQPEKVDRFTQVKNKGYDLMLAVDISA